jgi:uncharacterized protein (PEP-CTERM system associated)
MRPDQGRFSLRVLGGLTLALLWNVGQAQTLAPTRTDRIQPYIDWRSLVTDNVNFAAAGKTRKDLINTVTPGISVMSRAPMLQWGGDLQVTQVNYVRESQPDRLLPRGLMSAHLGAAQDPLGLDASFEASQTRSSFTQTLSNDAATQDTYTDYRARLIPSWNQRFGPLTELRARAEHNWLISKGNSSQLSQRPNSQADNANLMLRRAPAPLGADLSGEAQRSQINGQSEPALMRSALRAGLAYAPSPELELGLILGTERTKVPLNATTDPIRGWRVRFRPIERSQLDVQVESHGYGQTWQGAISHRNPGFSLTLQTQRSAETGTTSIGRTPAGMSLRDALDAMLTSRISSPAERGQAVDNLIAQRNLNANGTGSRDLYDLSAQLKEMTSARLTLLGKHNALSLTAGMSRAHPLSLGPTDSLNLSTNTLAKEYFVDTQYGQDLSPFLKWSLGVRYARASALTSNNGAQLATLSRELAWTSAIDWRLSPEASITLGLRRLASHRDAQTSTISNELYGGLGYRF